MKQATSSLTNYAGIVILVIIFQTLLLSSVSGQEISVPPTQGKISLAMTVLSCNYTASSPLTDISMNTGIGNFTLNGKLFQGAVYQAQEWTSTGYLLFDIIGIATDGSEVAVLYTYSSLSGGAVSYAYYESYTEPMNYEYARTGDQTAVLASSSFTAYFPALNTLPKPVRTGITITGSKISLSPNGEAGWVIVNQVNNTLLPFNTVDCSDCGNGGWYELHSMISPDSASACFVIAYLEFSDHSSVILDYGLCFPTLARISNEEYSASWSGNVIPTLTRDHPSFPHH